ncbi:hypothetical protein HWV62_4185, partial [Athelia sp. TMB]
MKPLEHSNKVVAEYWKKEPQTIIDEIAEYREYLYLHPEAADRNDESEYSNDDPEDDWLDDDGLDAKMDKAFDPLEATAREYLNNQAATSRTLTPLLKELNKRTGYVGALILAAPDPARGGELSTIRPLIAWTGANTIRETCGAKHVEDPLIEFGSLIYPPEKRKDFRLPGVSIHVPAAEDDTY